MKLATNYKLAFNKLAFILFCLALLLALPFALRPKGIYVQSAEDTLSILSAHSEAVRYEFTRAFTEFYKQHTGRTIRLDWRMIGSSGDIMRYIQSEFAASFAQWCTQRELPTTKEWRNAFNDGSITLPSDPRLDTPKEAARRTFLESNTSIGIDLLFGGGTADFIKQAKGGYLVDSGLLKKHPAWFQANSIPPEISGSPCYDPQGLWIGTCLTSFGICFNRDSLKRLGVQEISPQWETLASPKFINEVALADPTHSTSAATAYEMIVQQQMQKAVQAGESKEAGWEKGLSILQRIGANTRYFTDSGSLVPLDVSQGEAALGVCIDFYGRFLSESIQVATGRDRMGYFTPPNGSAFTVDPIAILRGAPHTQAARLFIEFVLSLEGQKLWAFRAGTAGGPTVYALRRLPIRKELYAPEFFAFLSDPKVNPYQEVAGFEYRDEWTAPLLHALAFIIRAMCMDSRQELVAAWKALDAAGFPPQATARFGDLSSVSYSQVVGPLRTLLQSKNPLEEIRTARMLAEHFRKQYKEAAILARAGK